MEKRMVSAKQIVEDKVMNLFYEKMDLTDLRERIKNGNVTDPDDTEFNIFQGYYNHQCEYMKVKIDFSKNTVVITDVHLLGIFVGQEDKVNIIREELIEYIGDLKKVFNKYMTMLLQKFITTHKVEPYIILMEFEMFDLMRDSWTTRRLNITYRECSVKRSSFPMIISGEQDGKYSPIDIDDLVGVLKRV